jgi:anthranilate synthase component I
MFISIHDEAFSFEGDTLKLFAKLTRGRTNTVLFESRDRSGEFGNQSLLFVGMAIRLCGRGRQVKLVALNENGRRALLELRPQLEEMGQVQEDVDQLTLQVQAARSDLSDLERIKETSILDVVERCCTGWQIDGMPLRMPGVFAYDLIDTFEDLPEAKTDRNQFDDFVVWLPDEMVLLNHVNSQATAVAITYGKPESEDAHTKSRQAAKKLAAKVVSANAAWEESPLYDVQPKDFYEQPVDVDMDDEQFAQLVVRLKENIRAGDVFQIVPSRVFSTPCPDTYSAFGVLRQLNPSPYMFYLSYEKYVLFGASPEACVRVSSSAHGNTIQIHPIAGTRPRGIAASGQVDADLDSRYEAELKLNQKELAEHMMLVDLARNDVARVSRPGTRHVARLAVVERYSHVMHLVSVVEGVLKDGISALRAYAASMNMGTLVGAPKLQAAKLLRQFELSKRGPYGGAVGYLSSNGDFDSAIVIRSALVVDGVAQIRAGAGVVHDSDPHAEAVETRLKANAVIRAIHLSTGGPR